MRDYIKNVIIAKHEQGYQVYPEDKGNYVDGKLVGTNLGISAPALKQYLGRTPTVKDMKELKLKTALDILENEYYKRPKIDKLPESIRKNVLDMAINAGPKRAVKILQRLVGAKQDGAIGPKTLKKLRESKITNNDYVDARRDYYLRLIKRKPIYKKFKNGWLNRVESFRKKEAPKQTIKVEEVEKVKEIKKVEPEVNPINKQLEDMEEWDSYEREFDSPPEPEFEVPVDQSVPYGVYAQNEPEFVEAEQAQMWAAKGGEVKKYDNGGEVVDEYEDSWMRDYQIKSTPEYLRSPEYQDEPVDIPGVPGYVPQEQTEEEKKAEFAELYKPHEGSRWGGEQFRDPTGMGAKLETESMVEVDDEGQETVLEEEKDVVEKVGKGVSGSWEEEKVVDKEVTTQAAPAKTLPKLSRKDFLEIRELQDEKKLREAEDEAIALAQKQSQIDPKRFYKNMGTFNKVVSLVALAAGAYGAYKHGGPNLYIKQLDDAVKKDIEEQKLGQVQEARKLAAVNFKIATLAKRLARSTTNLNRSQNFENLALKYQQKGVKEVKKQEKKRRDVATLAQLNTRGVTDNELAYLSVNFPKMKIENQVIKGRDGLNYYIKGGTSRANKVKEYVANAQQTVDGLNDLMGYVDKVQLWEQGDFNPVGALFSQDRAEAQSLRDRLVGNLRIEFFGPGVMTDQEREQAKKILGDPNRLLTSDSREKAKINNLMMKVNYGVRQKLRSDGVALPVSPNERKIAQMLKRRKLANVPVNRRKVVDQLIFEEKKWVKKGGTPGKWWDPNEPLAI
jgi:lysozyme family protein